MREIQSNIAATAFTNDKCKSIFTEKWKSKDDCSVECWESIKEAAKQAGGAKCCLAKYYEEMLDFTYGSGKPLPGSQWLEGVTMGQDCTSSSVPCTHISDAVQYCIDKHESSNKADAELYLPKYCASASTLATSLLLSLSSATLILSNIFFRA